MLHLSHALLLAAGMSFAASQVLADEASPPPPPSKHQLMKECMAKQKASDGGMPKEDMKKACRDVTSTEAENEKTEKKGEAAGKPAEFPQG